MLPFKHPEILDQAPEAADALARQESGCDAASRVMTATESGWREAGIYNCVFESRHPVRRCVSCWSRLPRSALSSTDCRWSVRPVGMGRRPLNELRRCSPDGTVRLFAAALAGRAADLAAPALARPAATRISAQPRRTLRLLRSIGGKFADLGACGVGRRDPGGAAADRGVAEALARSSHPADRHDADRTRGGPAGLWRGRGPGLPALRLSGCG